MLAAAVVWTVPLYESTSTYREGAATITVERRTTLPQQSRGGATVFSIWLPALISLLAVCLRRLQVWAGAIVLVFSLLGAMSVGLLYLPSAVALLFPKLRTYFA